LLQLRREWDDELALIAQLEVGQEALDFVPREQGRVTVNEDCNSHDTESVLPRANESHVPAREVTGLNVFTCDIDLFSVTKRVGVRIFVVANSDEETWIII